MFIEARYKTDTSSVGGQCNDCLFWVVAVIHSCAATRVRHCPPTEDEFVSTGYL